MPLRKRFDESADSGVSTATTQPAESTEPTQQQTATETTDSTVTFTPEQQAIIDATAQTVLAEMSQQPAETPTETAIDAETLQQAVQDAVAAQLQVQQQTQQPSQQQRTQSASLLYGGGAPAVRQGQNVLASNGYSVSQAAQYVNGQVEPEDAKTEIQMSRKLKSSFMQLGFRPAGRFQGREPLIVPLAQSMIPSDVATDIKQSIGGIDELMAQTVQGHDGADVMGRLVQSFQSRGSSIEEMQAVSQALSIFDKTKGAGFTSAGPQGDFIGLLRSLEIMSRAGATQVVLPPNGYLPFNRQTGSTTAYWVGENQSITTSEPTMGDLILQAKKIAVRVNSPNELMMFGGSQAESFIRADMALSMAIAIDLAALEGTGTSTQPLGIYNSADIQQHTSTLTVAANGNTFNTASPSGMKGDLEDKNFDPEREGSCNFIMRPKLWHQNITEKKDSNGAYLFGLSSNLNDSAISRMRGQTVLRSTQVNNTLVKGSSSDLSYVLLGIFKELLMARVGVVEFATSIEGDTVFANYQTGLRAVQHVDVGIRRPDAFVVADKIDMDL